MTLDMIEVSPAEDMNASVASGLGADPLNMVTGEPTTDVALTPSDIGACMEHEKNGTGSPAIIAACRSLS